MVTSLLNQFRNCFDSIDGMKELFDQQGATVMCNLITTYEKNGRSVFHKLCERESRLEVLMWLCKIYDQCHKESNKESSRPLLYYLTAGDQKGKQPIHVAAEYQLKHTINFLVEECEVDANMTDGVGNNILHYICGAGESPSNSESRLAALTSILPHCHYHSINVLNGANQSPLHLALTLEGQGTVINIVKLLLEHGGNIFLGHDRNMKTPFEVAISDGIKFIKLIAAHTKETLSANEKAEYLDYVSKLRNGDGRAKGFLKRKWSEDLAASVPVATAAASPSPSPAPTTPAPAPAQSPIASPIHSPVMVAVPTSTPLFRVNTNAATSSIYSWDSDSSTPMSSPPHSSPVSYASSSCDTFDDDRVIKRHKPETHLSKPLGVSVGSPIHVAATSAATPITMSDAVTSSSTVINPYAAQSTHDAIFNEMEQEQHEETKYELSENVENYTLINEGARTDEQVMNTKEVQKSANEEATIHEATENQSPNVLNNLNGEEKPISYQSSLSVLQYRELLLTRGVLDRRFFRPPSGWLNTPETQEIQEHLFEEVKKIIPGGNSKTKSKKEKKAKISTSTLKSKQQQIPKPLTIDSLAASLLPRPTIAPKGMEVFNMVINQTLLSKLGLQSQVPQHSTPWSGGGTYSRLPWYNGSGNAYYSNSHDHDVPSTTTVVNDVNSKDNHDAQEKTAHMEREEETVHGQMQEEEVANKTIQQSPLEPNALHPPPHVASYFLQPDPLLNEVSNIPAGSRSLHAHISVQSTLLSATVDATSSVSGPTNTIYQPEMPSSSNAAAKPTTVAPVAFSRVGNKIVEVIDLVSDDENEGNDEEEATEVQRDELDRDDDEPVLGAGVNLEEVQVEQTQQVVKESIAMEAHPVINSSSTSQEQPLLPASDGVVSPTLLESFFRQKLSFLNDAAIGQAITDLQRYLQDHGIMIVQGSSNNV